MTRVPVGDQPKDIDRQIREMVKSFIIKVNAIIVAVTPANIDLANSDALQLAKEVDAEGLRTIGVITKIDLMDKGTNAMDILANRVLSLKLGFVGVVSRSQQDIVESKSIQESLSSEKKFFQNHPIYRKIAHKMGTAYLAQNLNKLLLDHIHDCLPNLKIKISHSLAEAEKEMLSFGDSLYDERTNKGALLLSILTKFSDDYKAAIEGKLIDTNAKELYGGARINYTFNEVYLTGLSAMGALDGINPNDIRTALRNATGPKNSLFVPEITFELLTKRQISRLLEPSLHCVDMVYEELLRIVSQLESKELIRFGILRERVMEVITELLNECRIPTREMIENLIYIELAFVNTSHPDFIGAGGLTKYLVDRLSGEKIAAKEAEIRKKAMEDAKAQLEAERSSRNQQNATNPPTSTRQDKSTAQQQPPPPLQIQTTLSSGITARQIKKEDKVTSMMAGFVKNKSHKRKSQSKVSLDNVKLVIKAEGPLTENEKFETDLIKLLMESYYAIVRKNTQDITPKSIMYFLVNKSKEALHNRLVERLYKEELFDELLGESPEIVARRKTAKELVAMLKRATEIMNEVRDFALK
jgi:replication fork clamp-binding protein CrfC